MENKSNRHGSEKRQRTALMAIRFTPAEKEQLQTRAADAGMDVGSYVRHQTLGTKGPRTVRRITPELAELARVRGTLGSLGNNLNQLTRAVNMGDLDRPRDLDEALTCILDLLDKVRRAEGIKS